MIFNDHPILFALLLVASGIGLILILLRLMTKGIGL